MRDKDKHKPKLEEQWQWNIAWSPRSSHVSSDEIKVLSKNAFKQYIEPGADVE